MANTSTTWEKARAWGVHLFTASGLLAGFMSIVAISAKDWRSAMAWLLVALFIDGVDGTFARMFRSKDVLPNVNGKHIDYVVDFANYAIVPAYFFYAAELAGPNLSLPLVFLILLVSAVYYGIEGMVSEDFYFIGFPVMWNVVMFYLMFVFSFPAWGNASIVVMLAVLHFVPIKFAYPSRATRLKTMTLIASLIGLAVIPAVLWFYPDVPPVLKWIAVGTLCYFGVLAIYDSFRKTK